VEQRYARDVIAQPEVRRYVLNDAKHRVDALRLLEETPPGLRRAGLEELAFFAWSSTELALRGVSSAVEIQDASGALVSRFALNLPSLSSLPLPSNEQWKEDESVLELARSARTVLHTRRLLTYHGAVHGAVHVMVADDFWNLSFLRGRDPYSELFRTRPARDRPVEFLSWDEDGALTFSSAERPAPLPRDAVERARKGGHPTLLEVRTYRYMGHSMSDPLHGVYRTKDEVEEQKKKDPITQLAERLKEEKTLDQAGLDAMDAEIHAQVDEAVKFADESPDPDPAELYTDVLAD